MQDSRKNHILDWVRRIGFFVVLFIVLKLSSYFFDPVRTGMEGQASEDLRFKDYYMACDEHIDVLIAGDSESITLISTLDMWKEKGYASFVVGQPGQNIPETYFNLKDMIKKDKPKLVIIEAHGITNGGDNLALAVAVRSFAEYNFPVLKYHNAWKAMVSEKKEYATNFNGFEIRPFVNGYNGAPVNLSSADTKVSMISRVYLKRIKKLCDDNDIKLLVVSAPSVLNYNEEVISSVRDITSEYGIDYLDLHSISGDIGIDWNYHTIDGGDHLNYYGSQKVTDYIIPIIEEKYDIPDRRGEEDYKDWDKKIDEMYKEYFPES